MEFHNVLKKLRNENNLTLQELSNKTGIGVSALSNYETNRRIPELKSIYILANFFKVSLDVMLTGKESEYKKEQSNLKDDIPEEAIKELGDYKAYLKFKYSILKR